MIDLFAVRISSYKKLCAISIAHSFLYYSNQIHQFSGRRNDSVISQMLKFFSVTESPIDQNRNSTRILSSPKIHLRITDVDQSAILLSMHLPQSLLHHRRIRFLGHVFSLSKRNIEYSRKKGRNQFLNRSIEFIRDSA